MTSDFALEVAINTPKITILKVYEPIVSLCTAMQLVVAADVVVFI